jgi:cephalosporin hydroxylase
VTGARPPEHAQPVAGAAFRPRDWQRHLLRARPGSFVARQFARLYYARVESTVFGTRFLGVQTLKYPTDLWIYQEIVSETLPEVIVETGTWHGGSALFLAVVCDALAHGRVVTIDTQPGDPLPRHPRISYLRGSSVDPGVLAQVREQTAGADGVMVILDSDHGYEHVLAELEAYADIVTPGNYLIVEDTNVNGHPVLRDHGPGPAEARDEFLRRERRYEADRGRERLLISANPGGFLRRTR